MSGFDSASGRAVPFLMTAAAACPAPFHDRLAYRF